MNAHPAQVGLAQLSLVGTAPPDLVRIAAAAGFDFIGARVRPVTADERAYDLQPGSAMLADTLRAVSETGVSIKDIEFLLLDGSDQRAAWLAMMAAGQGLGATTLTVAASLADRDRLATTLGQMTEDGKEFGIMPTLEVISYQAVNSLTLAAGLARQAGCLLVADTLHLSRIGVDGDHLREYAELVPMIQLCDGPAAAPPDRGGLVRESRSERGVPGEGDFRLAELVAALPETTPVSVEAPSDATVARIGEQAWADRLRRSVDTVLTTAGHLRAQDLTRMDADHPATQAPNQTR